MAINLLDITSNNNDLTNHNTVTEVTSSLPFLQSTIAVDMDSASSQWLSASDSASLSITANMTIEYWVKFTTTPTSGNTVVPMAKDNGSDTRSWSNFLTNNVGTLELHMAIFDSGVGDDDFFITPTINTGTWYHVAITVTPGNASATTFEFFFDGSSQGNGTQTTAGNAAEIDDLGQDVTIGARSIGDLNADAQFDDVRIWNDIRTSGEISDNKDNELVGTESGLVAYWPFEIGLGAAGGNFLPLL